MGSMQTAPYWCKQGLKVIDQRHPVTALCYTHKDTKLSGSPRERRKAVITCSSSKVSDAREKAPHSSTQTWHADVFFICRALHLLTAFREKECRSDLRVRLHVGQRTGEYTLPAPRCCSTTNASCCSSLWKS